MSNFRATSFLGRMPIPMYSEKPNGRYTTQEFPPVPVAHGFPNVVDKYEVSVSMAPERRIHDMISIMDILSKRTVAVRWAY